MVNKSTALEATTVNYYFKYVVYQYVANHIQESNLVEASRVI